MTTTIGWVLVVDDDDSMRKSIVRVLQAAGLEAIGYTSAEELLAGRDYERANCVVSDLRLPAMSGLDLIAELRTRRVELPVVVITGHDQPGLREEAVRRGASAYLPKPFRGVVLLENVKAVISQAKAAMEAGPQL